MNNLKTKEEFINAIIKESGVNAKGVWLDVEDELFYNLAKDFITTIAYLNPIIIKGERQILLELTKLDGILKGKFLYQFLNGKTIIDYSYLIINDEILNSKFDADKTYKEKIIEIIAFVKEKLKLN